MLSTKFYLLYFAWQVLTCSCRPDYKQHTFELPEIKSTIRQVGMLPAVVDESSGLARKQGTNLLLTHNDSGGQPELYAVDSTGQLHETLPIPFSTNHDWEELATDPAGNIYIGDFGNNSQSRRNLTIYQYKNGQTNRIDFTYADQTAFPSPELRFDCEAMFWHNDSLHLFTKNHTPTKQRITTHYAVPAKAGSYVLQPLGQFSTTAAVTAADISPDGSTFALLTYGKIIFFKVVGNRINFQQPYACVKTRRKQTEALLYLTPTKLLFTNEQRQVFTLKLHDRKR